MDESRCVSRFPCHPPDKLIGVGWVCCLLATQTPGHSSSQPQIYVPWLQCILQLCADARASTVDSVAIVTGAGGKSNNRVTLCLAPLRESEDSSPRPRSNLWRGNWKSTSRVC